MNFKPLRENIKNLYDLSFETMEKLEDICNYWSSSFVDTVKALEVISAKYSFENLAGLRRADSEVTRLEFWKDVGQYGLTPALDDHDIDLEFIHFVKCFEDNATFRNQAEIPDEELDLYYQCIDRLFYTWVGFAWQTAKGFNSGIAMCTVENNSTLMFYMNDFLFDGLSKFHIVQPNQRITGSAFCRELTPLEIFARTNRNFKWNDREIIWELNKEELSATASIANNTTSFKTKDTDKTIHHSPTKSYDNSNEVACSYFIELCDQYINEGWYLKEVKCQ